jgi:peptidoglycan/LPS O-acetylase OafA/YrhL
MLTLGGLAMVWLRSLPLPEWLGWIALQFGRHSMAIYLLHVVAISVLAKLPLGDGPFRFVVVLAATVTAAVAAGWAADSVRDWHHTRQQPQPRPVR